MRVLGTMRSTESNMAFVWQLIFNVEILLLLFFRSQREANFQLHTEVWRFFMKYYFVLDCYNYTRWLSVYLFDCKALKFTAPGVFIAFMDGCFLFQKTSTEFSRIPLDQVHEQNNAYIRGVAGETHLVNHTDEAGLIRWELCSNELAMMIQEFENNYMMEMMMMKKITMPLENITKTHYHSKSVFWKMLQNCIAILPAILLNSVS